MAQAEPSNVTASCGEDGGVPVREASSSVAGDQYVTALASSSCSQYVSASMSDVQIAAAIEESREQGWSELKDGAADAAAASCHDQDALLWEELKERNPGFFGDVSVDELSLGRLIAEGGQAQIYEAWITENALQWVAKVFKREGFSLADLKRQWPLATKAPLDKWSLDGRRGFVLGEVVFGEFMAQCSHVYCGTFLKDGRFAFVMPRYWGDLRTLIDLKWRDNNSQGPPFSQSEAEMIMSHIAEGMMDLHDRGVLHRDLKAANVLIAPYGRNPRHSSFYRCVVADYESAMLVQGTKFWRAPEVLEELLKEQCDRNEEMWTEKVDIYSYGMTCYEVLTGQVPFDGYFKSHWKRVIDGERPHLPDYIDSILRELVEKCWHKEPSKRPTFEVIVAKLDKLMENIMYKD